jgi:aminoglycoside 6-adenylyltransferase
MLKNTDEKAVIKKITEWAESKPDIRAVLLTSSRANPNATLDEFSDYDVIFVTEDINPYLEDEKWLGDLGKVLMIYRDPIRFEYGFERFTRVTYYWDYLRIDYTAWPIGLLQHIASITELPSYLDDGYKILLDKDNLAKGMKPPTYLAFMPKPPMEKEYLEIIDNFYNEAMYVAKSIRRDNIFAIKLNMDHWMKQVYLRTMLEWLMEIENGWNVKTSAFGKGLKKLIKPKLWAELESTYVGAGKEENWEALFKTINLFRKIVDEVGKSLHYAFPADMDCRVMEYLQKVKEKKLP